MKKSDVCNILKLLRLRVVHFYKQAFKNLSFNLSLVFVAFSLLVSLFLLLPSTFSKVPVFSYLTKTMELPIAYELEGKVTIVDSQENALNQKVRVCLGGYITETRTDEVFVADFTAPSTDCIYIIIEYENLDGIQKTYLERLETNQNVKLRKEFRIYV